MALYSRPAKYSREFGLSRRFHTQKVDDILSSSEGGDSARNRQELAAEFPMRRLASPPAEVAWCVHSLPPTARAYVPRSTFRSIVATLRPAYRISEFKFVVYRVAEESRVSRSSRPTGCPLSRHGVTTYLCGYHRAQPKSPCSSRGTIGPEHPGASVCRRLCAVLPSAAVASPVRQGRPGGCGWSPSLASSVVNLPEIAGLFPPQGGGTSCTCSIAWVRYSNSWLRCRCGPWFACPPGRHRLGTSLPFTSHGLFFAGVGHQHLHGLCSI